MAQYSRPVVPAWTNSVDDVLRTREKLDRWAKTPQLGRLVEAFGKVRPDLEGGALFDWLERFAAAHWDFRAGAERNLARRVSLEPEVKQLVFDLAFSLGLAGPYELRRKRYDTILMTGGMVRAGIVKPRFARELVDAGVGVRNVVVGGSRT